jgi:hypothetical protein
MSLSRSDLQSLELDVGHIRRNGVEEYVKNTGDYTELLIKRLEQLANELKLKRGDVKC